MTGVARQPRAVRYMSCLGGVCALAGHTDFAAYSSTEDIAGALDSHTQVLGCNGGRYAECLRLMHAAGAGVW